MRSLSGPRREVQLPHIIQLFKEKPKLATTYQPDVDKGTRTIDGTIEIAPATVHLDVRLVNVPTLADPPFTPPPEAIDEGRCQPRLPIANRLIALNSMPRIRNISGKSRRLSL